MTESHALWLAAGSALLTIAGLAWVVWTLISAFPRPKF